MVKRIILIIFAILLSSTASIIAQSFTIGVFLGAGDSYSFESFGLTMSVGPNVNLQFGFELSFPPFINLSIFERITFRSFWLKNTTKLNLLYFAPEKFGFQYMTNTLSGGVSLIGNKSPAEFSKDPLQFNIFIEDSEVTTRLDVGIGLSTFRKDFYEPEKLFTELPYSFELNYYQIGKF